MVLIDQGLPSKGWSLPIYICWGIPKQKVEAFVDVSKTHRFEIFFPIILNTIFQAGFCNNLSRPMHTALRVHSRYLFTTVSCSVISKIATCSWLHFASLSRRFFLFAQHNINPIVLSLLCHFQKVQSHFCSSKIGRVTKFWVKLSHFQNFGKDETTAIVSRQSFPKNWNLKILPMI